MAKKRNVQITCYGITETMNRKKALEIYLDAMMASDGCERDRYTSVYCGLEKGHNYVTDSWEWYD